MLRWLIPLLTFYLLVNALPRTNRQTSPQGHYSANLPVNLHTAKELSFGAPSGDENVSKSAQPQSKDGKSQPATTDSTISLVLPPVDKTVDLDGDGALSLAEVKYAAFVHHGLSSNVIESLFNEVDKNRDGYLTSLEFNDIRPLVLAKAESAAQRYMQTVDTDHNGLLSLKEAQDYILKEYGIGNRDVERVWRLVIPNIDAEMNAMLFSKLRRRIRGMSIRLARQIMKYADTNEDGHIDKKEAQHIAFEQEGISAGDVNEMLMSVDDNNDGELNAPEFADFERIVRARAVDTSKKALKVVDRDGSGTITMDEAKRIAFDHYGFDEKVLAPFFAQADENEDGQLDAIEFAGFRSVIRDKAVKNAYEALQETDVDGDGLVNNSEAVAMAKRQDDMDPKETYNLFLIADQDKSGKLDKVEFADLLRLVRLNAIKFASDHLKEFDTIDELASLIESKYKVDRSVVQQFFEKVDVDKSGDLGPGELVDFRHEIRRYVTERDAQKHYEKSNSRNGEDSEQSTTETLLSDNKNQIKGSSEVAEHTGPTNMMELMAPSAKLGGKSSVHQKTTENSKQQSMEINQSLRTKNAKTMRKAGPRTTTSESANANESKEAEGALSRTSVNAEDSSEAISSTAGEYSRSVFASTSVVSTNRGQHHATTFVESVEPLDSTNDSDATQADLSDEHLEQDELDTKIPNDRKEAESEVNNMSEFREKQKQMAEMRQTDNDQTINNQLTAGMHVAEEDMADNQLKMTTGSQKVASNEKQ